MELTVNQVFNLEGIFSKMVAAKVAATSYEVNFNLFLLRKALREWQERVEKFKQQHFVTDEEGEAISYLVNPGGELEELAKGEAIKLVGMGKQVGNKLTEQGEKGLLKFEAETFDLDLKKLPLDGLKEDAKVLGTAGVEYSEIIVSFVE